MSFFEGGGKSRIHDDVADVHKRFDAAVKAAKTDSQKRNLEMERSEAVRAVCKRYGQTGRGGFLE